MVRGVRREVPGGVPRSTQGGGQPLRPARRRLRPGRPVRMCGVSFARPDHPIAYGYPARTTCSARTFRSTAPRAAGCAWRTARPVWMVRRPSGVVLDGAIAKVRRWS